MIWFKREKRLNEIAAQFSTDEYAISISEVKRNCDGTELTGTTTITYKDGFTRYTTYDTYIDQASDGHWFFNESAVTARIKNHAYYLATHYNDDHRWFTYTNKLTKLLSGIDCFGDCIMNDSTLHTDYKRAVIYMNLCQNYDDFEEYKKYVNSQFIKASHKQSNVDKKYYLTEITADFPHTSYNSYERWHYYYLQKVQSDEQNKLITAAAIDLDKYLDEVNAEYRAQRNAAATENE